MHILYVYIGTIRRLTVTCYIVPGTYLDQYPSGPVASVHGGRLESNEQNYRARQAPLYRACSARPSGEVIGTMRSDPALFLSISTRAYQYTPLPHLFNVILATRFA